MFQLRQVSGNCLLNIVGIAYLITQFRRYIPNRRPQITVNFDEHAGEDVDGLQLNWIIKKKINMKFRPVWAGKVRLRWWDGERFWRKETKCFFKNWVNNRKVKIPARKSSFPRSAPRWRVPRQLALLRSLIRRLQCMRWWGLNANSYLHLISTSIGFQGSGRNWRNEGASASKSLTVPLMMPTPELILDL